MFKSKFWGWDDVLAVDYTRSADSVSKVSKKLGTKVRQLHIQTGRPTHTGTHTDTKTEEDIDKPDGYELQKPMCSSLLSLHLELLDCVPFIGVLLKEGDAFELSMLSFKVSVR